MNSSRFLKKLFTLGLSASTAVFASSYVLNLDSLQDDSASAPEADVTGTGTAFGSSITTPFTLNVYNTFYIDETTGYLMGAGYNGAGGLGNNSTSSDAYTSWYALRKNNSATDNSASNPTKANETGYFTNVRDFINGGPQTLVIDEDGAVWSAGWNDFGQLGNGTTTTQTTFKVTDITSGAVKVGSGDRGSLVLMDDGSVHVVGSNATIGLGSSGNTLSFTETIDRFTTDSKRGVVDMSAGLQASYILFGDGDLWYSSSATGGSWDLMASNIKMFDIDPFNDYMYAVTTSNVVMYAHYEDTEFTQMATQPTEEVMQIRGGGGGSGKNYSWGYLTTSGNLYLSSNAVQPSSAYATSAAVKQNTVTTDNPTGYVTYFDIGGYGAASGSSGVVYSYLTADGLLNLWGDNLYGTLATGNTTDLAYANRKTYDIGKTDVDINGGIVNTPPYAPGTVKSSFFL